ncbi:MAG TPA: type II 3-dehydroquinate dehydratase [Bacteroidota bacterium]|nr:type II 3-dehydroquinate dehydratase [Bacteroidota bacterium]
MHILVINGPNLNLLGTREPEVYGTLSLKNIEDGLRAGFQQVAFTFFQSNHEGAIIDKLQAAQSEKVDGIVLNAAAYTHYSYAIRDAIAAIPIPVIEVHISNILTREEFRKHSVTAPVCKAQISGFGTDGYRIAVDTLIEHSSSPTQ